MSKTSDPLKIYLPSEVEPYRDDIRRFLDAMVFKLGKNAHKGRWENYDLLEALDMLNSERDELERAIGRGNMVEVMLEAADVANFALIITAKMVEHGNDE